MGLLDGGIRDLFGSVLAGLYLDGTHYEVALIGNGKGGFSESITTQSIKGQRDNADETMRREEGYTATDMKLIILQAGKRPINTDDRIFLDGQMWQIKSVREDAAGSHWIVRGSTTEWSPDTGGIA